MDAHQHPDESGRSTPDSVRLALPTEAVAIVDMQRRHWEHRWPAEVSQPLLAGTERAAMVAAWHRAIVRPPEARFRVLVATAGGPAGTGLVGFAATVPSHDDDAEATDGLIDEFVIDPLAVRAGHGSRLLNACVDTLRADGFTRATGWVSASDDDTRAFLVAAGWAPDGGHRDLGDEDQTVRIKQIRLHTDIGD